MTDLDKIFENFEEDETINWDDKIEGFLEEVVKLDYATFCDNFTPYSYFNYSLVRGLRSYYYNYYEIRDEVDYELIMDIYQNLMKRSDDIRDTLQELWLDLIDDVITADEDYEDYDCNGFCWLPIIFYMITGEITYNKYLSNTPEGFGTWLKNLEDNNL